MEQNLRSSI